MKKEFIDKLFNDGIVVRNSPLGKDIENWLNKELSKLNPMRIDEERICEIYNEGECKSFREIIQEYNSNLPEYVDWKKAYDTLLSEIKTSNAWYESKIAELKKEQLVPLPEEMPEEFRDEHDRFRSAYISWQWVVNHYGTPQKELPSDSELERDIFRVINQYVTPETMSYNLSKHLIAKYKLDGKKEEWWMGLKKGDKFMVKNRVEVFSDLMINSIKGDEYFISACHPYTEPSIHDIAREKLGDELYEKLMKEVQCFSKT
jgi:hypothetical protein